LAIVNQQHERRHGALGHDLADALRGGSVNHRRARLEQAKLKGGLFRMLHREPAVIAVLHVGVHLEPQLVHVELERFFLIANV